MSKKIRTAIKTCILNHCRVTANQTKIFANEALDTIFIIFEGKEMTKFPIEKIEDAIECFLEADDTPSRSKTDDAIERWSGEGGSICDDD